MPHQTKHLVVGYCRSAPASATGQSATIKQQQTILRRFARRHGLVIERFYSDDGVPTMTLRRSALDHLIHDCQGGLIRTVLVSSLDRFSRGAELAALALETFERLGVQVLIADQSSHARKSLRKPIKRGGAAL